MEQLLLLFEYEINIFDVKKKSGFLNDLQVEMSKRQKTFILRSTGSGQKCSKLKHFQAKISKKKKFLW